ncbi:MAG: hypothetical protein IKY12_02015, partial [Clostridia bacterium]|nr:hypothetical protein [Clostridia bacterium]
FDTYLMGTGYDTQISENGGRFAEDSLLNTYLEFSAGETDYLVLNLDYDASADKIEWMCEVVEAHPNHKVIITTHAFVSRLGKISTEWGEDVWDNFIKKYENIVLVLSGHETYNDTVVIKQNGIHGNTVTMMMINPQILDKFSGPCGVVCMLYFKNDGISVEVENYSTVKEKYVIDTNQFTMAFNEVVGDVNLDYDVTLLDALLALKSTVNRDNFNKADMNGDGEVTLLDVIRIFKRSVS